MTKRQKQNLIKGVLTVICLIILAALWFILKPGQDELPTYDVPNGTAEVHFIDVGQGDSIFIELPNSETMLIDAGEIGQGDSISTYIFSQGYDTIDYVVATHSHSDHIGGMPEVLDTFNIGALAFA